MRRQPPRSRASDARRRRFGPVKRGSSQVPLWLWGIGAALFVIVVGAALLVVVPSFLGGGKPTPSSHPNTLPSGVESPESSETPVTRSGLTPTALVSPTVTPLPTEPPQSCRVLKSSWVRSAPRNNSIGLASLDGGAPLTVIGKVEEDGVLWYRVAEYPPDAYILAESVQCP